MEINKAYMFKAPQKRVQPKKTVDWSKYRDTILKQVIPIDEPCKHDEFSYLSKQTRCADEIQTNFITCRLCGKVETS